MRTIETTIENVHQYDDEPPLWRVRHGREIIVQTEDYEAAQAAKAEYDLSAAEGMTMIAQHIEIEERTSYQVGDDGVLIGAPCCCYGDNHDGHPYCQAPPPELLQAERDRLIVRQLDTGWRWIRSNPSRRAPVEAIRRGRCRVSSEGDTFSARDVQATPYRAILFAIIAR